MRSFWMDRALRGSAQSEVDMSRFHAIVAAALLMTFGGTVAYAGDFMPRAAGGFAAVGDDPGSRSTSVDGAMSESDCPTAAHSDPGPAAAPRRATRVGADDTSADTRASTPVVADADDKAASAPAPAHKSRSLRWQSLLPGVMK
jgi:hypothetical protein